MVDPALVCSSCDRRHAREVREEGWEGRNKIKSGKGPEIGKDVGIARAGK